MATSPLVKLTFGSRTLELNSGNYAPGIDFVPPSARYAAQFAEGTSANVYGGSTKAGQKAINRPFTFSIQINGSSTAEINRAANRLTSFLALAGVDERKPLYLEYWPNSDVGFEPLWGQYGANLRYEIVHADPPQPWDLYPVAGLRETAVHYNTNLIVKPFAIGTEQQLATAAGGILEDTIGSVDGISRGLVLSEATTNYHHNPVFGNGTAWNTSWTNSANITDTENTDEQFIIYGTSSAKLTASGGDGQYTESKTLSATTFQLSYYIKLPDGGTVSSTQVQVRYGGSDQATTYTSVGNGWYRIHASVTGSGVAATTGVTIKSGYTIYMDMAQVEAKSYPTPAGYGDMLGWSWSGTSHASNSVRVAASVKIPISSTTFTPESGTVRMVVKMPFANGNGPATFYFADMRDASNTTAFYVLYSNSTTTLTFHDGTGGVGDASFTWSAGEIIVFHFVYGPGEKTIYKNGASVATVAAFTPPTVGADIVLGQRYNAANPGLIVYHDFSTFSRPMTAVEALADYNNVTQWVSGGDGLGQRLSPIPYLWTKDGDDVVDNCDDSTRNNWAVAGGIPGDAPALTRFDFTRNFDKGFKTVLSLLPVNPFDFLKPSDFLFFDRSDTVDANSCGGQYNALSSVLSWIDLASDITDEMYRLLEGKTFYLYARMALDRDATVNIALEYSSTGLTIDGKTKNITQHGAANFGLYSSPALTFPMSSKFDLDNISFGADQNINFHLDFGTSFTTNVNTDYITVLPRPLMEITPFAFKGGANQSFVVTDKIALLHESGTPEAFAEMLGDVIELLPEKWNLLMSLMGDENSDPLITYTITYDKIKIIPRWSLI